MSKKRMKTIIIFSLVLIGLIVPSVQANIFQDIWLYFFPNSDDVLARQAGKIWLEDTNNVIGIELEITGLSPRNTAIIDINKFGKKKVNGKFDLILISPKPFNNIKATSWKDVEDLITTSLNYSCSGNKYGILNDVFYCNTTYNKTDNITMNIEYYDMPINVRISNQSYLNNNIVYWNETYLNKYERQKDVSNNVLISNIQTEYGNYQYYLKNEDFKANKEDKYRFEVTPNLNDLPIKYTVCIGDISIQGNWFCLDPVITNSRTWTTTADFTNETTQTNLTNSDDIQLSSNTVGEVFIWEDFEDGTDDTFPARFVLDYGGGNWDVETTSAMNGSFSLQLKAASDDAWNTMSHDTTVPADYCYYMEIQMLSTKSTIGTLVRDTNGGDGYGVIWHTEPTGTGDVRPHEFSDGSISDVNSGEYINLNIDNGERGTIRGCIVGTTNYFNATKGATTVSGSSTDSTHTGGSFSLIGYNHNDGRSFMVDNICVYNGSVTIDDCKNGVGTVGTTNTQGLYDDTQSWTPQAGNTITNISIELTTTGTSTTQFRYNTTETLRNTSQWVTFSNNGTNVINTTLTADQNISYSFLVQDTGSSTPLITSYTIYEVLVSAGSDSCTKPVSGTWTIQGSDSCNITTTQAMGGENIVFNGTGTIRIQADFTNCGDVLLQGISDSQKIEVTVENNANFCN